MGDNDCQAIAGSWRGIYIYRSGSLNGSSGDIDLDIGADCHVSGENTMDTWIGGFPVEWTCCYEGEAGIDGSAFWAEVEGTGSCDCSWPAFLEGELSGSEISGVFEEQSENGDFAIQRR